MLNFISYVNQGAIIDDYLGREFAWYIFVV